jgi:S1-C subfamily serine protease
MRRLLPATALVSSVLTCAIPASSTRAADLADTVERVKLSIVAVGTYEAARSPSFMFLGTGFVVGDGSLVATSAHVLPAVLDTSRREQLAVAVAAQQPALQIRSAKRVADDPVHDLAVLQIEGSTLPSLPLGESPLVREGETFLFTGFPIGAALGLVPVTHRAMISALTRIALPLGNANQLQARTIKRLGANPYPIMQLDATAYPGNSGSPLYHPETGRVVGIVNMVFIKGTKEAALSQPSGISYAMPVHPLKELLKSLP